ncbi:MAG: UDP-2,4-diacetamido-2,4,6-trideoxy-beta-L-altropyranose hydrolase [Deltaproteobacteria bacterium]|nr:UDP-2,4-diacetamido-2,4,6-trideoxy-beta-L-altropyranose hydrolase [Deltaproteobacteria bacterium]
MQVVIRADASVQIGSGHVMRCLTLADELRRRGADLTFVCREHPGNLIGAIAGKGYGVVILRQEAKTYSVRSGDVVHAAWLGVPWEQDARETLDSLGEAIPDWLIIDHYGIDRRWEETLRPHVGRIMVIDDLADRPHDCELLLDQNLYKGMETRYDKLVPLGCKKLLGPQYALLRPEFAIARKNLRQRDGQIRRVLVFFGGVDPTNETAKSVRALAGIMDHRLEVDVVVGNGNIHKQGIQEQCTEKDGFYYHCQVNNMAELMAAADLSIGAGGSATWERCSVGLPSITISIARNQVETTEVVADRGAAWYLGESANVHIEHIQDALLCALKHPDQLREMGTRAVRLMATGGDEAAHPLLQAILEVGNAQT